jgi:hypothetical protein
MANRFPLTFNTSSNRIEELKSGDSLDLSGSALLDSTGQPGTSGQVLQSTATGTVWSTFSGGGGGGSDVSPVVMGMIF